MIFDLTKYEIEDIFDLGLCLINNNAKFVIISDFLLLSENNNINIKELLG